MLKGGNYPIAHHKSALENDTSRSLSFKESSLVFPF